MTILRDINRDLGLAMLIVEQNAAAALRIASFVYVLEGGRVVFKGPAAKLHRPPGHQGVLSRRRGRRRTQLPGGPAVRPQAEMVGMSGGGATLEVRDVSLTFGGITAIKSVSFTAHASELLAMVGPNGAGKTALLNCINGIYRPQAGTDPVGRRRPRRPPAAQDGGTRHRPRVPARRAVPPPDRAREPADRPPRRFRAGLWASGIYCGQGAAGRSRGAAARRGGRRFLRALSPSRRAGRARCRSASRRWSASRARSRWSRSCCCWTSRAPA